MAQSSTEGPIIEFFNRNTHINRKVFTIALIHFYLMGRLEKTISVWSIRGLGSCFPTTIKPTTNYLLVKLPFVRVQFNHPAPSGPVKLVLVAGCHYLPSEIEHFHWNTVYMEKNHFINMVEEYSKELWRRNVVERNLFDRYGGRESHFKSIGDTNQGVIAQGTVGCTTAPSTGVDWRTVLTVESSLLV